MMYYYCYYCTSYFVLMLHVQDQSCGHTLVQYCEQLMASVGLPPKRAIVFGSGMGLTSFQLATTFSQVRRIALLVQYMYYCRFQLQGLCIAQAIE